MEMEDIWILGKGNTAADELSFSCGASTRTCRSDRVSLKMRMRDAFSQYYAGELEGSYDSPDRMVINAYFEVGQSGGGFRWWWRKLFGGDEKLDDDHIRKMAGEFSRRLRGYCKSKAIPVIYCEAGARKHELAETLLPEDPKFRGIFAVLVARAPAPVWEVLHTEEGKIFEVRRKQDEHGRWPYVNHYYFQILDKEWGHVCVRMSGYPPFGAQVIVNGHEWLECTARRSQFDYRKVGNSFVEGSDFLQLHRRARELMGKKASSTLRALCDRWLYSSCACFAISLKDQKKSSFRYTYSSFQLEFSRNLCFKRGALLDEIYQKVIERTRASLSIKKLKTIFGARHRPHRRLPEPGFGSSGPQRKKKRGRRVAEVSKEVRELGPQYDLTVFTVRWGKLSLKIYDKGSGMLRVEAIAHNVKALGCRKKIENLPEQLSILEGMLRRFLATLQAAHSAFLDAGAFVRFVEPTKRGSRRLAGIDLNKGRMCAVIEGVSALATKPEGFKISDVVEQVAPRITAKMLRGKRRYGVRQAAYDLAKLRGKKVVHKIKDTRRYEIRPEGMRTLSAYVMLREKVLKPMMAGARGTRMGRPPKNIHPIDTHYLAMQRELLAAFKAMGLAS